MIKGFVLGKYYPFHLGHKAKIDFALTKCDFLYVIVCASDKETIDVTTRANWIRDTFPDNKNIEVIEFSYSEEDLASSSESSVEISEHWSNVLLELVPDVDMFISSEKYGEYVSDFMGVIHQYFDPDRKIVPISATDVRKSYYDNWNYLPDSVKKYYQKSICFLGTECTGKSYVSETLSRKYNSTLVSEVGRDIVRDSNEFSIDDLYLIARRHAKNIKEAKQELKPFVFVDTDIHITQSYSLFSFGNYLKVKNRIYKKNKCDIYVYLNNDLPFEQDGTRLDEEDRNRLAEQHLQTLNEFCVKYIKISGSLEDRVNKIEELLFRQ
jgi:HTH-type transcriptional repressor of NAD biosynthesis genes